MERLIRTLIIVAASLAAVVWLLRDGEPRLSSSPPAPIAASTAPPVRDLRRDAVMPAATSALPAVAEVHPAPAVGESRSAAQASGVRVAAEPIPMIERIMLPGGMWNLHTMLERESRNDEWADEKERELSTYFASKPELARNFGQPSVLCRSRSCEVQAIGYGPRAFATWAAATQDLRDQPWRQEMRAGGIYTVERAPNEHAVVLILVRTSLLAGDRPREPRAVPPQQ